MHLHIFRLSCLTGSFEILERNCDPDKLITSSALCHVAQMELGFSLSGPPTEYNISEPAGCYANMVGESLTDVRFNKALNATAQINATGYKRAICRKTAPVLGILYLYIIIYINMHHSDCFFHSQSRGNTEK